MTLVDFVSAEATDSVQSLSAKLAEPVGISQDTLAGTAVVTGAVTTDRPLDGIPETLRERGLDPDAWIVERAVVNTWDTTAFNAGEAIAVTNHQLKIFLRAKLELQLVGAARVDGPQYLTSQGPLDSPKPLLVCFISDQQGSYHDPLLHQLTCEWMAHNHPDVLICGGDGVDFPALTRHGRNLDHEVTVQSCIDTMYRLARDYVSAAGETCRTKIYLEGNHEAHLQRAITDRLPQVYGLARAEGSLGVLSLPNLLRLDELGMDYIGNWPHGAFTMPYWDMMWRHGWLASGKSGASALATAEKLGCSVCVGHTHRRSVTYVAHQRPSSRDEYVAQESGTMATIQGGLGYDASPNWQNGFATAWLFPGGGISADNAKYSNGQLLWQDQVFGEPQKRHRAT